jgi:type I restriction enzyme R subunit
MKKSNFEFLKLRQAVLYESAVEAENSVLGGPRTSAFYSRRTLEIAVKWLFKNDRSLRMPYQETLSAMMHEPSFTQSLPPGMFQKIQVIRKLGNHAAHSDGKIGSHESLLLLKNLWSFLLWIASTYSKKPPEIQDFDESILDKSSIVDKKAKELRAIEEKFQSRDAELKAREEALKESEERLKELEAQLQELQSIKEQNKPKADKVAVEYNSLTESETRELFIDLMLREAGWDPKGENVEEYEVSPFPNKSNKGFVDYVLWGDDGKPLAVVEAKKTKKDPKIGQQQAKLYADSLEEMTGRRPIIFYSNGYKTFIWDDTAYPPREVSGFYKKEELLTLINRREVINPNIESAEINSDIAGRYYQKHAIKAVCENFQNKHRKSLVIMATGTGKTRTAIALVDLLMKNNWAKRVLFLADRNALIKQAKKNFNEHLPNATTVNLVVDKEDKTSRVSFSTYPTMMNLIDETKGKEKEKRFSPGHFDLIIIDEAHRSIYQKYRTIFQYFDSLVLGLTATPKDDVDKNTYEWFDIQDNVPHFVYELDTAVKDNYLVPYHVVDVPTKFQQEGIIYEELSPEEKEEYEEKFFDDETGELPEAIEPPKLNSWVFNKDTVDKVLSYLVENGLKVEGGDKLGKTIVFAKNHKHAMFIEERFNILFPHLKGEFLAVIDNQINYADTLIEKFYIGDKDPHVAVSVDMLDTGIDVPEILNLVFFKIVRSKSKFWQMIGRGTRPCENLLGPGDDKKHFYIFDFCENFKFFGENPDGYAAKAQPSISQKIFEKRLLIAQVLNKKGIEMSSYLDDLHKSVEKLNVHNFINRPHRQIIEKFQDRENWNSLTEGDISDILNDLSQLSLPEGEDEIARRFDLLMYSLEESFLTNSKMIENQQKRLDKICKGLQKKKNVPAIAKHMNLIDSVVDKSLWTEVDIEKLEKLRRSLRELIKFLDHEDGKDDVFSNFEDEFGEAVIHSPETVSQDLKLEDYKQKIQKFYTDHKDNMAIFKLRNNKPITKGDIENLEMILFEDDAEAKEKFSRLYGPSKPLGMFIRETIGMDRESVLEAFSGVIGDNFTAAQTQFLNNIVEYITHNGHLDIGELYEPPFTNYHDNGLDGVFESEIGDQLVAIIKNINSQVEIVA